MPNFAVLDGELVINVIVADSKEAAEEITGMTCVESISERAEPGGTYSGGVFFRKKPYSSWILDENNDWKAPVPYPLSDSEPFQLYEWDEATTSWVILTSE